MLIKFDVTERKNKMALEKINISDGITLNIIKTDKFKTNYLSFNFVCNLNDDKASLNALLPQVLIRGTEKHPDMASLKTALDDLYAASIEARVYKRGEYQVVGMSAGWLDDKYSIDGTEITLGTLDMLEEVLFCPYTENGVFAKGYVESEKSNLVDDIRAAINNKTSYAINRCKEEMCKNEPYGISVYGKEEQVESITPESLYDAYTNLLETSRIEIFYVGSYDGSKMAERIKDMFKNRGRNYKAPSSAVVIKEVESVKEINEQCQATQGKLSLGFRCGCSLGERDYKAFPLFVEIYGGSPVSKLFMNVREKLSLCYYCRAIPEGLKGIMVVTSGIEVENKQKTQDEIIEQLEKIKRGEITDEEIVLAKKSMKNAYNELQDNPASLEGWYLTRRLADLGDTPEDVIGGILEISKDEIVETAKKIELDTVYFLEGTQKSREVSDDE